MKINAVEDILSSYNSKKHSPTKFIIDLNFDYLKFLEFVANFTSILDYEHYEQNCMLSYSENFLKPLYNDALAQSKSFGLLRIITLNAFEDVTECMYNIWVNERSSASEHLQKFTKLVEFQIEMCDFCFFSDFSKLMLELQHKVYTQILSTFDNLIDYYTEAQKFYIFFCEILDTISGLIYFEQLRDEYFKQSLSIKITAKWVSISNVTELDEKFNRFDLLPTFLANITKDGSIEFSKQWIKVISYFIFP